jgi:hypothetical protein
LIKAGTLSLLFTTTSLRVMVAFPDVKVLSGFSCADNGIEKTRQKKAGMKYFMPARY